MKKTNIRQAACLLLKDIINEKKPFNPDSIREKYPHLKSSDHNFLANLVFGVLRWFYLLEKCIDDALDKPLKTKDFLATLRTLVEPICTAVT